MTHAKKHSIRHSWRTLRRLMAHTLTAAQLVCVAAFGACAASVYISPVKCSWLSVLGLGFPLLLGLVCGVLLLALIFTPRRAWISLVGILACIGSIRNYMPFNIPSEPPVDAWHVMSWNVGGAAWNDSTHDAMRTFLTESQLDLLGLQELGNARADKFREALSYRMPYFCNQASNDDYTGLCLFSRWPIVGNEIICRSSGNMAQAYSVVISPKDTLIVLNCHLQSMHIDNNTRSDYEAIMHRENTNADTLETTSRSIVRYIRENSKIRALQADTIYQYLEKNSNKRLIVMGDFNDTPISYTRQHIMQAAPLLDCFREAGNGISRTFNRNAIYVRIDHILASGIYFKPYATHVTTTKLSDHNPVETYLSNINNY